MSVQQSFGRYVSVRVFATQTNPGEISYNNGYTEFASVQKDGSQGFRISGKITQVEATIGIGINPITLSIYNLGPDSRALLTSKVGTKISVFAGYGSNIRQLAVGNILYSKTTKQGPDYITEIIAGDGHFAVTNGQINLSFSGNTTYKQVIDALVSSLEDVGVYAGTIQVPDGGYNQGIVLSGSPLDLVAEVCQKMGSRYVVIANALNIIPLGQDIGAPLIEISKETGMIGIPEVQSPGTIGVIQPTSQVSPQNNISFNTLLRPEIGLFQKVRITSKFVNGEYTVGRAVHDFDSWTGPFFTECQASIGLRPNG